jgi:hypothetical protein
LLYQYVETSSIEVIWLLSQPFPHLHFNLFIISETFAMFLDPVVKCFTLQTLPTINTKNCIMNIPCIESFWPQRMHNRTVIFGGTHLKHGRYFDYRNQPQNMCMLVCYWNYHEAGLYCYLVIHIENILHLLQLFYFHLWPIYWLSLIRTITIIVNVSVPFYFVNMEIDYVMVKSISWFNVYVM